VVKEAENGAKKRQMMSGMRKIPYWIGHWLFDYSCFLFNALVVLCTVAALDIPIFRERLEGLFVLMLTFGLSMCPFNYCCSFIFKSSSSAANAMIILGTFFPLLISGLTILFKNSTEAVLNNFAAPIESMGWLLPSQVLASSFVNLIYLKKCSPQDLECEDPDQWSLDVYGTSILVATVEGFVFFLLLLAMEYKSDDAQISYERKVECTEDGVQIKWMPTGRWLSELRHFTQDAVFNTFIMTCVIVNTVCIIMDMFNPTNDDAIAFLDGANIVFTVIFAVEMLLKILGWGIFGYVREAFNIFDAVLAISSLVDLILAQNGAFSVGKSARGVKAAKAVKIARLGRISRIFRLFRVLRLLRNFNVKSFIAAVKKAGLYGGINIDSKRNQLTEMLGARAERFRIVPDKFLKEYESSYLEAQTRKNARKLRRKERKEKRAAKLEKKKLRESMRKSILSPASHNRGGSNPVFFGEDNGRAAASDVVVAISPTSPLSPVSPRSAPEVIPLSPSSFSQRELKEKETNSKGEKKKLKKKRPIKNGDKNAIEENTLEGRIELLKSEIFWNDKKDNIIVKELVKQYTGENGVFTANDDLCFGIRESECFGLLGPNGAGKSTLLDILTGLQAPTSGTSRILNSNSSTQLGEIAHRIGFCPQFDATLEKLSGRESLEYFCEVRGVSKDEIKPIVTSLINGCGLAEYADRECDTYSGGNKRKLSIASSLLGNPDVLFLDEPTTAM
jgi:energy-coupling factor transporter ATP-binding protein EcfA2